MKYLLTAASITLLLTFSSLSVSAQRTPTTPIEFNDYLVAITDSLYEMGRQWGTKFNEVNKSKKYNELILTRKQMESYIIKKQAVVKNLQNISGSEELKAAHLEFLNYELAVVKTAFVPLEKLSASSSDAEIAKALEDLRSASARETEALQKVVAAQVAYGKKNGFTVQGATEQTDN